MITFRVPDMRCGHCAGAIKNAITALGPSSLVTVDVSQKLVHVTGAATRADFAQAIHRAGYGAQEAEFPACARAESVGCGCGCGPRKAMAVDARQGRAVSTGSCCS